MPSTTGLGANSRTMNGLNTLSANTISTGSLVVDNLQIDVAGTTPLIVPLTTSNSNIANTAFVQGAILTAAANYMDLTTNQIVATGIKTFTSLPQSAAVPTLGDELVNKNFTDATYVDFTNNESIGGIKTFTNSIVATQIEGPTNSDITIEGKGTGDVILKTGSTNRITCADTGAITIAGSSGQPMNITTTGILTLRSASTTAINIGDNQTSGELNIGTAAARTGTINIGTGADSISAKTINIGNTTGSVGALNLKTRTITVGGSNCVSISADATTNSIQGTTVNIKTTETSGTLSMGTAMTSGNIDIGTAASSTTTFNIGTGTGTRIMNIGGPATTLNLGTTAVTGQVTALNWGTTSNSGNLTFRGGSFTLTATGNYTQRSGSAYNTSIDSTKTTGETLIADGNSQTGKIDIGTGTGTKIMNLGGTGTTVNLVGSSITCNTVLPTSILTPTTSTQLTTKTYVDSEITTAATAYAKLASANAFTSTNTFNSFLPTSTLTPTLGTELVTKTFTDATYVALTGAQSIAGIKTFTSLPECSAVPSTANQLTNKTFTDATYVALTGAQSIAGIKTFTSLPECSAVPSTANQLTNKTFTDATYVALTGAQSIAGIKTFTSLPECSAVPSTGNQLVNKTFTDANYVDFTNTETISGAKTFSSTVTFKNGASAQTGTIAQDATTLTITGVTGDVSIKPALDFNVVTGTGKNVNISAPSTASLSSTMILTTGTTNASSYIELVTSGVQLKTKASQPALLLSGAFTTANAWLFYRDGTATAAINRMDSRNAGDTCHLEVAAGSNIVLTQNTSTFNSNLLLN